MKLAPTLVLILLVGIVPLSTSCAAAQSRVDVPMPPTVSGAAGPFGRVTVTVTTARDGGAGSFSGVVVTPDGKRLTLPGPDEPADLFLLEPRAVLFTPIDRTRTNGIVILYNSSQIGPQHGTDRRALVYRLTRSAAVRQLRIEERLEGVANAAAARAKLKSGK